TDGVPAHVRDAIGPEALDAAFEDADPGGLDAVLHAAGEEDLLADADAEDGRSVVDALADDRVEAVLDDPGHAGGEGSHAGDDEALGPAGGVEVAGELDLAPGPLQRPVRGAEVPGAVVEQGDARFGHCGLLAVDEV